MKGPPHGNVIWISFLVVLLTAVLIASLWGFVYASPPSDDECWTVKSWGKGSWHPVQGYWYRGLPGTDLRLAWEETSDFLTLHLLYVFAMISSGIGLVMSVQMWRQKVSYEMTTNRRVKAYIGAMMGYFVAGFIISLMTQVCFVRNRCSDHNLDFINYSEFSAQYRPRDGPGWLQVSTSSAKWAKALYLTMTFTGGFLANTLLELSLLRRAIVMEGTEVFATHIRIVKTFMYIMLFLNLLAVPVTLVFYVKMMDEGVEAVGGVDSGDIITILFNVAAVLFATLHIYISLVLLRVFVTLMKKFSDHPLAIAKVLICTSIAIVSTLVCYGNMAGMFVNAYILLPTDSLTNNICMIILNFTGSFQDEFRQSFYAKDDDNHFIGQISETQGKTDSEVGVKRETSKSGSPKNTFDKTPSLAMSVQSSVMSALQDAKNMLFPTSYSNLEEDGPKRQSAKSDDMLTPGNEALRFGKSDAPKIDLSKFNSADLKGIIGSRANKTTGQNAVPPPSTPGMECAPGYSSYGTTGGMTPQGGLTPSSHFGVPVASTPTAVTPTGKLGFGQRASDDFDGDIDADEGVLGGYQSQTGPPGAQTPLGVSPYASINPYQSGHTPYESHASLGGVTLVDQNMSLGGRTPVDQSMSVGGNLPMTPSDSNIRQMAMVTEDSPNVDFSQMTTSDLQNASSRRGANSKSSGYHAPPPGPGF